MSLDSVALVKSLIQKHDIQCDLKQGVLHVANKAKHAEALKRSVDYKQQQLHYEDIEYLDQAQVSAMLGSEKYHGGEYWRQGAHLHPLNYALGLAQAADKAGVRI